MSQSSIKYRSMIVQILLMVVTLGLYAVYWFYQVSYELKDATHDETASPALWTVLLFVPFGALYSFYKLGEIYEKWSPDHWKRSSETATVHSRSARSFCCSGYWAECPRSFGSIARAS